ncbi:MAG TPA: ABC transporter transmembrane domain-containing protein, partial [Opitutaceae bacterium]|nr:ABC transporter transmembrane domain-containing protein [Opitutaceae bacterium]
MLTTAQTGARYTNGELIRRLFALAWRYRLRCCQVLGLQLVLLTLGLFGLSFTGIGIDFIRHKVEHAPLPPNKLHLALPESWPALHVLALIGGCILGFAAIRAALNYFYTLLLNRLTQQELVVHLRDEAYSKLQRLSFRFFDANTTGSIITRVTGDVQSVRMFLEQV